MSEVSVKLKSIASKLQKINHKFEKLTQDNESLRKQNTDLKSQLDSELRRTQSLQNEYNRLKLAKTLVSTTSDKAEMKFKVNELVREIDKCMALLNR